MSLKDMVESAFYLLGGSCFFVSFLAFVMALYFRWKLGDAMSVKHAALWEEMRPGFYSDISTSREHSRRFDDFLDSKEYLGLQDARITRAAIACQRSVVVAKACLAIWLVFMVWLMVAPDV